MSKELDKVLEMKRAMERVFGKTPEIEYTEEWGYGEIKGELPQLLSKSTVAWWTCPHGVCPNLGCLIASDCCGVSGSCQCDEKTTFLPPSESDE